MYHFGSIFFQPAAVTGIECLRKDIKPEEPGLGDFAVLFGMDREIVRNKDDIVVAFPVGKVGIGSHQTEASNLCADLFADLAAGGSLEGFAALDAATPAIFERTRGKGVQTPWRTTLGRGGGDKRLMSPETISRHYF